MPLYTALLLMTVTIHTSTKYPTPMNPEAYGLNTCSGVFVGPDEVLTAAHCVKRSRGKIWIKTSDDKSFSVTIKREDVYKDLALLKIQGAKVSYPYARFGPPVDIGQYVYTVNSGEDLIGTFNQGIVNNLINEPDYNVLNVMHSASIMQGASGSGLFNKNKELIGINTATIKGFALAVDIFEIKSFMGVR